MRDDALSEQRELIELVESADWDVTDVELSVYESPWEDDDAPEATVTITARKTFGEDGSPADKNQFRHS